MAVDASLIGRHYPVGASFLVGREAVRDFSRAIGAVHPHHFDVAAARSAGFADVVSPSTFACVVGQRSTDRLIDDPEVGIQYFRVVHGEQAFTHHAPIVAGDELGVALTVDAVRMAGPVAMLTIRNEIGTMTGEPRCTAVTMLVHRAAEPG